MLRNDVRVRASELGIIISRKVGERCHVGMSPTLSACSFVIAYDPWKRHIVHVQETNCIRLRDSSLCGERIVSRLHGSRCAGLPMPYEVERQRFNCGSTKLGFFDSSPLPSSAKVLFESHLIKPPFSVMASIWPRSSKLRLQMCL
jgi:hypothetical protein